MPDTMFTLIRIELFKIFRKPRTYIAFGAVASIIWLIQLGFWADGESYINFGMQALSDSFDVQGRVLNGYLLGYIILQTLLVNVPLLIALVSGDMISGEANMGTLRLLASRPVSRNQIIVSKFLASSIYTIALLVWMAIWTLFFYMFILGVDDMIIMKSEVVTQILQTDIMWRYAAAFVYAMLAMVTVSALAFFLMVADTRFKVTQPLRAALATVLHPVERALLTPLQAWRAAGDYLDGASGLRQRESEALRQVALQAERAARILWEA